jgi:hypothetical protein
MPSFSTLAVASVLALGAFARPQGPNGAPNRRWGGDNFCLTRYEAQQVATNYGNLIASYSTSLAQVALSPDFTDYSESVNTLIDECPQGSAAQAQTVPLLMATFSNRTAFETGQGQQPQINFNQLNIWHSCDTVNIRWETTNTAFISSSRPVVGMIAMEVSQAPQGNEYPYWIDTVYSEFDAGAWLSNLIDAGICKGNVTFPARH